MQDYVVFQQGGKGPAGRLVREGTIHFGPFVFPDRRAGFQPRIGEGWLVNLRPGNEGGRKGPTFYWAVPVEGPFVAFEWSGWWKGDEKVPEIWLYVKPIRERSFVIRQGSVLHGFKEDWHQLFYRPEQVEEFKKEKTYLVEVREERLAAITARVRSLAAPGRDQVPGVSFVPPALSVFIGYTLEACIFGNQRPVTEDQPAEVWLDIIEKGLEPYRCPQCKGTDSMWMGATWRCRACQTDWECSRNWPASILEEKIRENGDEKRLSLDEVRAAWGLPQRA